MSRPVFTTHTLETAPASGRSTIEAVRQNFGYLPVAVARMAESPETLKGFLTVNRIFEQTGLSPIEREVLVFTVATRNGCHLCVAMHTAALHRLGAAPELIEALRDGTPLAEPKLEALRQFTRAVMAHQGAVPEAELEAFLAAGFLLRHALDVVLGIGAYTISTFANRLIDAPLDPPLAEYAWAPAG